MVCHSQLSIANNSHFTLGCHKTLNAAATSLYCKNVMRSAQWFTHLYLFFNFLYTVCKLLLITHWTANTNVFTHIYAAADVHALNPLMQHSLSIHSPETQKWGPSHPQLHSPLSLVALIPLHLEQTDRQ